MNSIKLILKITAIVTVICGIVFTIIYFKDDISEFCSKLKGKISKCCPICSDDDDFDDI